MITLYIDIKFIKEFEQRNDFNEEVISDFLNNFLKKIRGVKVVINAEDTSSFCTLSSENKYFYYISEIASPEIDSNWIKKLDNTERIYSGNPGKLFLVANDFNCDEYENKYSYIFINNDNLKQKWKPLQINSDYSELVPGNDKNDVYCFYSWKVLQNFKHRFNDLLFIDLYVLSDKTNEKIKDNLIPLLKEFSNYNSHNNINITLISGKIFNSRNDKEFEKIAEAKELLDRNPKLKTNIIYYSEVKMNNAKLPRIHDRVIFTNYLKFECPAGWNIFNGNGAINRDTKIIIQSLFKNATRNSALNAIKNVGKYFDLIKGGVNIIKAGKNDNNGKIETETVHYYLPDELNSAFLLLSDKSEN